MKQKIQPKVSINPNLNRTNNNATWKFMGYKEVVLPI